MANAATLNPPTSKTLPADEATLTIRDRVLGALYNATRGTNRPVNLAEIRARLDDVDGAEFDRIVSWLDREGVIVLDRGGDVTFVKLTQTGLAAETVPCDVKDRVLGAIWAVARGPMRIAHLQEVRSRVNDVTTVDFDRTIVALALQGDIELGRGTEQGWVRLSPTGKAMQNVPFHGMPVGGFQGYAAMNGATMPLTTPFAMPYGMPFSMPLAGYSPLPFGAFQVAMVRPLVERVAHQLWEQRGRHPGQDVQNWIDAEQIVRYQLCCGAL